MMEGKLLHLYENGHQAKMQPLENVVQRPPYGPFEHQNLLWEIIIWHIGMQQSPCLVEVAFIPITGVLDFIVGKEVQDSG